MPKRSSLAELMGKPGADKASSLELSHLPAMLGDGMPELPKNPLGRHRLIRSLQQRYGANFRSLPGIKDVIAEFDKEIEFEKRVAQIKAIKMKKAKHG